MKVDPSTIKSGHFDCSQSASALAAKHVAKSMNSTIVGAPDPRVDYIKVKRSVSSIPSPAPVQNDENDWLLAEMRNLFQNEKMRTTFGDASTILCDRNLIFRPDNAPADVFGVTIDKNVWNLGCRTYGPVICKNCKPEMAFNRQLIAKNVLLQRGTSVEKSMDIEFKDVYEFLSTWPAMRQVKIEERSPDAFIIESAHPDLQQDYHRVRFVVVSGVVLFGVIIPHERDGSFTAEGALVPGGDGFELMTFKSKGDFMKRTKFFKHNVNTAVEFVENIARTYSEHPFLRVDIDLGKDHVWHAETKTTFGNLWDFIYQEPQLIPYGMGMSVAMLYSSQHFLSRTMEIQTVSQYDQNIFKTATQYIQEDEVVSALLRK